jgi:hypothetical protein
MMRRLLPHDLSDAMNAAAPEGAAQCRINIYSKIPLPAVPRIGPDPGVLRIGTIFMVWV